MQKKPHPRIERLREIIAGFNGKKFTTSDLRKINNTNNLLSVLADLADAEEIKWCGKAKLKSSNIDIWQEVKLKTMLQIEAEQEQFIQANPDTIAADDLPGWRIAFPQLFRDPRIPGKKRMRMEF